ncbi:MAG: hypothetical protein PHE55_02645 [Methylococcaceae bacterium]|nr:hypothetical protein [Methylococcaceae bacterium]
MPKLFSREQVEQSRSGNPFDDIDLMAARIDQLFRNEDLQEKLRLSHWDLVVVDEAHKLLGQLLRQQAQQDQAPPTR